jgi:uncharacterized protein YcbK (DUF882 family)
MAYVDSVSVAHLSSETDFVNKLYESERGLTRRALLRTSLIGVAVAMAGQWIRPSVSAAGYLPEGRLTFVNIWTDERLDVTYRDEFGTYDLDALDDVNHILRCHHTGEVGAMDVRVIEHVNLVQKRLGGDREILVVSGFRSPEYNAILVRTGRRAAKNSLHMQGQAIDVQIAGVHPKTIRQAALELGYGGVGYYPRSKFVHLDSGPFRHWEGSHRARRSKA